MVEKKLEVQIITEKTLTNADIDLLRKVKGFGECPLCHKGQYGGIFMRSCDNPECKAYDAFYIGRCGICGAVRRKCCC